MAAGNTQVASQTWKGLWVGVSEFPPSEEMRQICREVAHNSGHWVHCSLASLSLGLKCTAGASHIASILTVNMGWLIWS